MSRTSDIRQSHNVPLVGLKKAAAGASHSTLHLLKAKTNTQDFEFKRLRFRMGLLTAVTVAGVGVVATVAIVPVVTGLGFTATGIAAGTVAAKMMSAAAIANGGGVASMAVGGLVAACQSIGALGAVKVGAGTVLAVSGAALLSPTP